MDRIKFEINGVPHSVGCEVTSDVTLLDYIRKAAELRGTKYMCREAGCGACIVAAVKRPGGPLMSVNACMVQITSCQDWQITTTEALGNKKKGYHILQKTLAQYNGTQCGYCTPSWIMAMFSLLHNNKEPTMLDIERSFGSNICRCTGYRPILEAFKTFAKDAPKPKQILDIEDLSVCKKTGKSCDKSSCDEDDWCLVSSEDVKQYNIIEIQLKDGRRWYRAHELNNIFEILNRDGYDSYMLIFGNTAKGAYPISAYPRTLIDISAIQELKSFIFDQNMVIGAGLTLTEILDIFKNAAQQEYFGYLQKFYDHLLLVAHIPVRNVGSMGGNLMIKHQHNEFPSDIFLLFETVGAQLTIVNAHGLVQIVTMEEFLKLDMRGHVILNARLPPLNKDSQIVTYKIMPRSQNAHAIVNAGFLYRLGKSDKRVQTCRLVYSGLSQSYTRALSTERFLIGKMPFTNETLQSAVRILKSELIVLENPPEPSVEYRKQLAVALFYKSLLSICPDNIIGPRYRTAASKIHETRPVSDARQIFDTNPTLWPLNQPVPKVEALIQCSGEAQFTEDLPALPYEVFGAFVLSWVSLGEIVDIDPSKALKEPGVITFYSANDIPGENNFTPGGSTFYVSTEEILCSKFVKYFNQPLGIIVAESQQIADRAAKMVEVKYRNLKTPVLDIKIAKKDPNRLTLFTSQDATERGNDIVKVISGENCIYGQYHFTMETLVCVTKPTEEGLEVHTAGQWMDGTQWMISRALNIDENCVDVYVRRLGGAYGIKVSRSIQVAIACSLVVQKLNRPCRFMQSLTANTRAMGKRLPCATDFELAVNSSGQIQYMNYNLYEDNGYKVNETLTFLGTDFYYNCYDNARWNYKCYDAVTDTAKNTWCRSPGTFENISQAEYVMEQISYEMSLDPLAVRLANLNLSRFSDLREMSETIKKNAEYTLRREATQKFNAQNRWKKRGLRIVFLRWTPAGSITLCVNMSVYHGDGSVVITHGGIEMGQGVNTKAVQICAYFLKIPIDKIQVKANNTIIAPNGFISGGSVTSQSVGIGVRRCCEELLKRLEPVRNKLNNPKWEQLIKTAFESNVDLQTHGFVGANDTQDYNIYGCTVAEVEVDILTGESEVLRVDLLEDVGLSVSPEIDIGQVEGAFIMGLGYWTCERLVYDPKTGELLTDRTWNYHVPQAGEIPQDFRVYFRKKSYSNELILGSKGTGEPPMCMSVVIAFAIREAIAAGRQESGIPSSQWFSLDGPSTVDKIALASATKFEDFKFY